MSGATYSRLFNSRLEHTFYTNGITKDLQVIPTSETFRSMKNANMQFRNDDTGFRILYSVDNSNNPFIDFKNVKLVFGVQLKNVTEFLNITALTTLPGYSPDKIMYISNIGTETTTDLNISFLDYLKSAIFNYEFPQTAANIGDDGSIIIRNSQGNVVTPSFPDPSLVKANGEKKWIYPIDFSKMPKGLYEFETTGNATTITKTVYIDNDLAKQNIFAIIEIIAKSGASGDFPIDRIYKIKFTERLTYWKYILVLKSGAVSVGDTIDIIDNSTPPQNPYGILTFTRKNNILINDVDGVEFTSYSTVAPVPPDTSVIPFYEIPKKDLIVQKNGVTVASSISSPVLNVISMMKEPVTQTDMTITYVTI